MRPADPFDLQRFRDAQEQGFESIRSELIRGEKRTHWMWFVFPQMRGLGSSSTAKYYGIGSASEARAYLDDSILGERLRDWTKLVNQVENRTAHQIFGPIDALKLNSSMTLFGHIAPEEPIFQQALDKFFDGHQDEKTLLLLIAR